ncbi:MAG: hypothetical protein JO138_08485 [Acidobacteriaceae bacterium]|nr:hypothetical protein [Acidobacteriota bacterium]MBV9499399.1 hypothetical protein [Acidobacteriaceae bacterium]
MESPKPERIGRRKELLALEYAATGGYPQFGHLPIHVQEIEGWTFRRCRCGFTLALTPSGTIFWLKITKPAVDIKNFKLLLRALNSNCLVHPRPEPLKVAVTPVEVSPINPVLPIADVGTKAGEPVVSKEGATMPPRQAKTQNESKPTSKQAMPGMSGLQKPQPIEQRVDKPPPVKQRRVYVPDTRTGSTRQRQRPFGR